MTGFQHPRCYLRSTKNCAKKISGEHWMSESVLREMGDLVMVSGVPWLALGETKAFSLKALSSNILCERHNSLLSTLDSEPAAFFRTLRTIDGAFVSKGSSPVFRTYPHDGRILERWMVKVLAGIIFSGIAHEAGERIKDAYNIDESLLIAALCDGRWQIGAGLHLAVANGAEFHSKDAVSIALLTAQASKRIVGVSLTIRGQQFDAPFDLSGGLPPSDRIHRPTHLVFGDGLRTHTVPLQWDPGWPERRIGIRVVSVQKSAERRSST